MDQSLKDLFERALDDEPLPPPGDPVLGAMRQGRHIRRRRYLLVGGSVATAVVAGGMAFAVTLPPAGSHQVAASACLTSFSVFLSEDATEAQQDAVQSSLRNDPQVKAVRFESREEAFKRFAELWRENPDFVKSVTPASLPESFLVTLTRSTVPEQFEAQYERVDGVVDVVIVPCPGAGK